MSEHHINLDELARSKDGGPHSIYGASSSHMYLACSGSLVPNVLADDVAGYDAAWGTVAHAITEEWLNTGRRPDHYLGTKRWVGRDIDNGHLIEIDSEMLYHAGLCVDRCEWEPGEQVVELHVDFSHLTPIPNQGGTLDFAALRPGRATTVDHKFGASPDNIVYAEENPQLMLYSIGLWRDPRYEHYDFQDFIIRINQPRLNHFDEWHTTARRLSEFEDYCRERMAAAWRLDAPRTPGPKQCRFCKVRATCAANAKLQEDLISGVFSDETQTVEQMRDFVARLDDDLEPFKMHMAQAGSLTTAQLARLHPYRRMAEAWWAAMDAELMRRGKDGEHIPGMKFVEGRSKRRFMSEAKAADALLSAGVPRDDLYQSKMISPNQAEKRLRKVGKRPDEIKELMSDLAFKPPGRATLVPLSDKRPGVEDVSTLVFENDEDRETEEDL